MTTTSATPDLLKIQQAKANLALLLISLGIPLTILASFSLMRATVFLPGAAAQEQPAPAPTSPWRSAPNVTPPQFNFDSGGSEQAQPNSAEVVPVPTAVEAWPTFDPNVPVVTDYEVVIPDPDGISQSFGCRCKAGYSTSSGMKGGGN